MLLRKFHGTKVTGFSLTKSRLRKIQIFSLHTKGHLVGKLGGVFEVLN